MRIGPAEQGAGRYVVGKAERFDQKNEIYHHYQQLDTAFYKQNSTGDLMNRITEDVSRVRMFTGPAIMYLANLVAIISLSVFFMLKRDAEKKKPSKGKKKAVKKSSPKKKPVKKKTTKKK